MAADRMTKATATALVLACMAAAVTAADDNQKGVMGGMCEATGFGEDCKQGNMTEAKEFIKETFDAAVEELQIAIKNTTFYKKMERDRMTRAALDVCERVLADSIDQVHTSLEKISEFEAGQMDRSLDVVKIWLSAAITFKDTCYDAFAKTRGSSGRVVRQMLKSSGHLLNKGLAMVIEFQKNFQSIKKNLGELVDSIRSPRQLLDEDEIPDFVSDHARKLIQSPKISLPPNVVVAQDGSGQFKTITEAISTVPLHSTTPFVILVKAGVYHEYVDIPKKVDEVILVGEGPLKTRITGDKSFGGHIQTYDSATLAVNGRGFIAKDIGIENTAGPIGHQAVAVRATGDVAIFYNVHIDGYQDTLYPHVQRQLFRECRISGTIDFIFGNAIAVFQKCDLVVRKPDPNQACMVTAQGRNNKNLTGITIIQGCTITGEQALLEANPPVKSYLGRPWKEESRTVIMQTTIEGFIDPEGWAPWNATSPVDMLYYVEYNNKGPGADQSKRVTWPGIKKLTTDEEMKQWTPLVHFVEDGWIKDSGVPFDPVFMPES
ncbi:pectinesterase-like [Salvia miltiorrhiza]|uniref:pectinesterase-like n=1 Tax=Salvia miltiorrhiza TaxID=226208 RepID=UPI0025AC44EB|nr:pectinesterase-like [Salvia miltiorrhiza]